MTDGVTLSSILGSQVSIQWYEAVALVREVADRLLNSSSERAIPELQQIRLSPEGHLEILGVTPTNEPVRRMGQLLQALLAHADAPVQLRLIITQATSPEPPYQSIREYSDALGFFERPERSTVLQSLASRVTAAAAAIHADRPLTLDSIAPLPAVEPKAEEQHSRAKKSRGWGLALVAVVILAVSAAGVWYARKQGIGPQNREEATALADKASDAVGSAILSGASAVTETLGLGRIVPAKEAPSPPPSSTPDSTPSSAAALKPSQPKRRDPAASSDPMPPVVAFDLDPMPTTVPALSGDRTTVATTASATGVPASQDDDTIYSVDTPAIAPPVGIRPKLARQLPPDFDPARLGRVELIIGSDGSVESAKLLGPPRTVNDGLFLSVAKAWTFQPALKGGVPVRYRKTIWVASP
jgi:hypothetical protein